MRTTVILLIAALLAAMGGSAAGTYFRPKAPPPPSLAVEPIQRLTVSQTDLDLGEVWETDRHEHVIHVTNPGTEPVEVASWQTSCDCHKVDPPTVTVKPGETLAVRLTLNLMPRSTELWTGHTRATAVAIKPRFANENTSAGWQIAGTVKPFYRPVSELPSTARSELAQPFAPDVLSVEFLVPVRGVRVMADAPLAGVRVIPPSAGETKHRIECQWLEKILIGSHVSTINVRASTVDGKSLPTIAIPCRLDVVEDVRLSQTNVNLVQTGHAVSAEEIVEVYSITSKGIFVTRIEQTVKDPHIVVSIRDASTVTVRATGTTTMTPRRHSVIVIIDSAGRRYEIPLQINIS